MEVVNKCSIEVRCCQSDSMPTFLLKVETSGKVAKSAGRAFQIFSGKILKMQEKGPAATNWLKMRVIPQRGVGGINQARKTNAHLQSRGLVQKILDLDKC